MPLIRSEYVASSVPTNRGVAPSVAVANAPALHDIWRQVVTDHTDARALGTLSGNVRQIRHVLDPRTPFGWLVPVGFAAFLLSRRARRTWPLWTFVPAAAGFLVLVRPLTDHHLVLLSTACAIAAGPSLALAVGSLARTPRTVAAAVLVLFVAAGLCAYAVHEFGEAGIIANSGTVFDVSNVLPESSPLGAVLSGLFGYRSAPTPLEVVAYFAYLIPVVTIYLWTDRPRQAPRPATA